MSYFVYILRTSGNTLYVGQTNNLERRLREHLEKKGKGSKYVRSFAGAKLVYKEEYQTRSEAMKREAVIRKWPKAKKEDLVGKMIN